MMCSWWVGITMDRRRYCFVSDIELMEEMIPLSVWKCRGLMGRCLVAQLYLFILLV